MVLSKIIFYLLQDGSIYICQKSFAILRYQVEEYLRSRILFHNQQESGNIRLVVAEAGAVILNKDLSGPSGDSVKTRPAGTRFPSLRWASPVSPATEGHRSEPTSVALQESLWYPQRLHGMISAIA